MRRIRRSRIAIRSGRQRSAVSAISGSIVAMPRRRVAGQRRREVAKRVGRRIGIRPLQREERFGRALDVAAADVPLIQDLQRRLARAMALILLARARHDAVAGGRVSCADDRRHLDRGDGRLAPLVRRPLAGARQRLLHRIRREHAERHRHAGGAGRRRQPVGHRRRDELHVRRLARIRQPRQMMAS